MIFLCSLTHGNDVSRSISWVASLCWRSRDQGKIALPLTRAATLSLLDITNSSILLECFIRPLNNRSRAVQSAHRRHHTIAPARSQCYSSALPELSIARLHLPSVRDVAIICGNSGLLTFNIAADQISPHESVRHTSRQSREHTGARVTVTFSRTEPVPVRHAVSVHYKIAEEGRARELQGTPQLTHTFLYGGHISYHYRLSQWIPATSIMDFV